MGNVENAGIKHKLFENPGKILENVLLQILITADQKLGSAEFLESINVQIWNMPTLNKFYQLLTNS